MREYTLHSASSTLCSLLVFLIGRIFRQFVWFVQRKLMCIMCGPFCMFSSSFLMSQSIFWGTISRSLEATGDTDRPTGAGRTLLFQFCCSAAFSSTDWSHLPFNSGTFPAFARLCSVLLMTLGSSSRRIFWTEYSRATHLSDEHRKMTDCLQEKEEVPFAIDILTIHQHQFCSSELFVSAPECIYSFSLFSFANP